MKRDLPLTPSKYFNQQPLNFTQSFASVSDCMFFAHSVMQKVQLNDQISIAMRKVASCSLNSGMLNKTFKTTVQQFIAQDNAYSFKSSMEGTLDTGSIMEKNFIWSFSNGEETWYSNIFYDSIMCRS